MTAHSKKTKTPPSRRVKLDKTDLQLLQYLQDRGRITNIELAELVGISAPTCLQRVRALEESGFIRGYHADLTPDALGYGVAVFSMVSLVSHSEVELSSFEKAVNKMPLVRLCYGMAGEIDFLLLIVAESLEQYEEFLARELRQLPNIKHITTSIAMRRAKYLPGVPVEMLLAEVDD